MSDIQFTPGRHDGSPWADVDDAESFPNLRSLIYLDLSVGDANTITGWVTPEVAKVIKAAPDLLSLANQYASECAECNGTRVVQVKQYPGDIEVDGERPCDECADIWRVIDKATK